MSQPFQCLHPLNPLPWLSKLITYHRYHLISLLVWYGVMSIIKMKSTLFDFKINWWNLIHLPALAFSSTLPSYPSFYHIQFVEDTLQHCVMQVGIKVGSLVYSKYWCGGFADKRWILHLFPNVWVMVISQLSSSDKPKCSPTARRLLANTLTHWQWSYEIWSVLVFSFYAPLGDVGCISWSELNMRIIYRIGGMWDDITVTTKHSFITESDQWWFAVMTRWNTKVKALLSAVHLSLL